MLSIAIVLFWLIGRIGLIRLIGRISQIMPISRIGLIRPIIDIILLRLLGAVFAAGARHLFADAALLQKVVLQRSINRRRSTSSW